MIGIVIHTNYKEQNIVFFSKLTNLNKNNLNNELSIM